MQVTILPQGLNLRYWIGFFLAPLFGRVDVCRLEIYVV